MYENYGGTQPKIPEGWVEVGYRSPRPGDVFLTNGDMSPKLCTEQIKDWFDGGDGNLENRRIILARKPVIDPAMVPPAGYQFRLDEYGRPVCRAPQAGEWFVNPNKRAERCVCHNWDWDIPVYILDPIPSPPKMTIVEAWQKALEDGPESTIRRRQWRKGASWPDGIIMLTAPDISADDWEVVL